MVGKVSRRAVFFLGGFDPRGGRHYYSVFKTEAAKMSEVTGADIEVSPRRNQERLSTQWKINYEEDGVAVETVYRTLNYDDLIRRHWVKSELSILWKMVKTYWLLLKHGFFKQRWRVQKPVFYMGIFLVLLVLVSLGAVAGVITLIWILSPWGAVMNAILSVVSVIVVLGIIRLIDRRMNYYWLMRGICFSGAQEQYDDPHYEGKMEVFAEEVSMTLLSEEFDEVLLVGHSSGALWASEVAGRVIAKGTFGNNRPLKSKLNVLTLGSCIPLMTGSTLNKGYHDHLKSLAFCDEVDWLDISERTDFAASYLVDPVALIPDVVKLEDYQPRIPRLQRARFFQLFDDAEFKQFQKDAYRVHFQFLYASDKDGPYNFFRLVCGPLSLTEQFKDS